MIHSARPTVPPIVNSILNWNFVLWDFEKCGRTVGVDVQTPRVKIVITTGRDCGSALLINFYWIFLFWWLRESRQKLPKNKIGWFLLDNFRNFFRLPLPWLLFTLANARAVTVSATGMVCSIAILFGMLCLVFFSILIFNWKMTKGMGLSMFLLYFAFVAVSLGFEYSFYSCPI